MRTLRPDQQQAIQSLRDAFRAGQRRIMLQAPTGYGKTIVLSDVVRSATSKGKRVLITVPALSLVDQTVESFWEHEIRDIGVIQANHHMTDWSQPVQVASVQTLMKRELPKADVVLIDEAHRWFRFYERWFMDAAWANTPFIGCSATPWTRGLGAYYKHLVIAATTQQMIDAKVLTPFRVFAPSHPDLAGVRTVGGDYHEGDLAERMNKASLVADAVVAWKQIGENRPTVCFAVNRAHAESISNQFNVAGIGAAYMDCETPEQQRKAIRRSFLAGEIRVVCNVDVIGMGVDWPEVSCLILARPTRSEMRFVQNVGRGLRAAEGKSDLIIIDHSDTHLRLGFVTDIHHAELSDGRTNAVAKREVALPKECPQCHALKPPRRAVCPNCGFKCEAHARVNVADGELQEINPGQRKRGSKAADSFPDKQQTYAELLGHALAHGYKPGWASNKYRDLYGVWPQRTRDVEPLAPGMLLTCWIKSQNIRWAKSRQRQQQMVDRHAMAEGHIQR